MNPMGFLERILLWAGGYSPRTLEADSRQEREPIAKLGGAVLVAALFAAGNWTTAGWIYSAGNAVEARAAITAAAGVLGILLVLAIDRPLLYLSDIMAKIFALRLAVFVALRVFVIVAVSSITSQAIMPVLLGREMAVAALQMQESSQAERVGRLRQEFAVDKHEKDAESAASEVARLVRAKATLPADITALLDGAARCRRQFNVEVKALVAEGLNEPEASERLSDAERKCAKKWSEATATKNAYLTATEKQLQLATGTRQTADSARDKVRAVVQERVDTAQAIEAGNLTPLSSTVLAYTLKNNPGALIKWAVLTIVQLIVELFPLYLKLQARQTLPGQRIARDNQLYQLRLASEFRRQEQLYALHDDIARGSQAGVQAAMATPEVRAVFAEAFATTLKALAPVEAVTSMMQDLEARGPDIEHFMGRYPRYAQIVGQAWANALQQVARVFEPNPIRPKALFGGGLGDQ